MDGRIVGSILSLALLVSSAVPPWSVAAEPKSELVWSLDSPATDPHVKVAPLYDSRTPEELLGSKQLWIAPRIEQEPKSLQWKSRQHSSRDADEAPTPTKSGQASPRKSANPPSKPSRRPSDKASSPVDLTLPAASDARTTKPTRRARVDDPQPTTKSSVRSKGSDTAPLPSATRVPIRRKPTKKKMSVAAVDTPPATIKPSKQIPLKPLSRRQRRLRTLIRKTLAHYHKRPLAADRRSPWEVMHGVLAYEVHSRILPAKGSNEPITAVGWLCFNRPCRNRTLLRVNDDGQLRVKVGPGLQGHEGQLLAMLAQAKVKRDYPIKVDGHDFTVADLIEVEKSTCYTRTELTFKLIGLMHYLDSDAMWVNNQGDSWDFRRMVTEELQQPIRGAACGGTHRLAGLSLAVKHRERARRSVDGEYARAKKFVANYQRYAFRLQNEDGSFSTEWFRGEGDDEDFNRRLKTTGHILEWLLYTSSPKQLRYSRLTYATTYLTNLMYSNRYHDWEAGPLGHAIHALVLYDRLVFSPYDDQPQRTAVGRNARGKR